MSAPYRPVGYLPGSANFQQNPFPALRRLQESDPVHLTRRGWVVTGYEHCSAVLASEDFGMAGIHEMFRRQAGPGPALDVLSHRFHSYDPPEHTRLRSLVAKAFTPRRIEGMRKHVRSIARSLLDDVAEFDEFDLIEALAYPLPSRVIAELLGIPAGDRAAVNSWTEDILNLQGSFEADGRLRAEGNSAAESFMAYAHDLVESRRSEPGSDLLSDLISADVDGSGLTAREVALSVVFLSNAGFSTTRNLIGNAVLALLEDPGQWAILLEDRSLVENAVDEILRYDCSLTSTPRFARRATRVGNRSISAGAAMYCVLNAANRDPERFPDPDRFLVQRSDTRHLAFGGGVHRCLGASLARVQVEEALSELLERYPRLKLSSGRTEWRSVLYRGPIRLHVTTG